MCAAGSMSFVDESVLVAGVSCATFLALKFMCKLGLSLVTSLPDTEKVEIGAKIVSGTHALLATFAGLVVLVLDHQGCCSWRVAFPNPLVFFTSKMILVVAISCGYFLYDCLWLLMDIMAHGAQDLERKLPYLCHHVACFIVYALCLHQRFGLPYIVFFLTWEISTPWLNLRWVLLKFANPELPQTKRTRALVDYTFAASFVLARLVAGNVVTYHLWFDLHAATLLNGANAVRCELCTCV